LSQAEFDAPRIGFFPSLAATLNHILAVDRYYVDALSGGGLGAAAFHGYRPFADKAALALAQDESDRALIALCDGETEAALAATTATDRGADRPPVSEVRERLYAHLFLHQIHHRGQAHAMLSGTSVKPPQLDEYWLAFDRDARAGDLAVLGMEDPSKLS
jgi:uncharacterized damage-inducible protein DinB